MYILLSVFNVDINQSVLLGTYTNDKMKTKKGFVKSASESFVSSLFCIDFHTEIVLR